ncbi:MAG: hypothetical protein U0168_12330 [Nannocystaceae bacterium]
MTLRRAIPLVCALAAACVDKADAGHALSTSVGDASDGGSEAGSEGASSDDGPAAPACGDGRCDADEDCASCAVDCNACPGPVCGDGRCDPGESCDACASDCGECCGNGICDAAPGESWSDCWGDCAAGAPLQPLQDLYPSCAGQTDILGVPPGDRLWVRSDTGALVYVSGDEPIELTGTVLVGGQVVQDGEPIGALACGVDPVQGCAPMLVVSVLPDTGGEQVPCLFSHLESLEITRSGDALDVAVGEYFEPCALLCGNGQCDPYEIDCGVTNQGHQCFDDCGTGDGCPACA